MPNKPSPKVSFKREELKKVLPQYRLISDTLEGEVAIKEGGERYLPMPSSDAHSCTIDDEKRYVAYLKRAVFYNATRRTALGLTGQVFMREPVLDLPEVLNSVVEDSTGSGVPLIQQMQKSLMTTLCFSRSGIMVDYPRTDGVTTLKDLEEGHIRPVIWTYRPEEIINWRTSKRGSKKILSMVVLADKYPMQDDGFEIKMARQYLVLKLNESDEYVQQIWRMSNPKELTYFEEKRDLFSDNYYSEFHNGSWFLHETSTPLDANGETFDEIPFKFLGTENNDPEIDQPNFYDLASLNIAHYRNSADFEESCFIIGQPTLAVAGLTKDWVEEVLNDEVRMGSRGGLPLPVGGTAHLVQANENNLILAAMEQKEKQMTGLGAKLIEARKVERTAFETRVERSSEGSVLGTTTINVQKGFLWALSWCMRFIDGSKGEKLTLKLNTDFDLTGMSPEERREVIDAWIDQAISWKEMRDFLRRSDIATEDDDKVKDELEEIQKKKAKDEESKLKMQAEKSKSLLKKEGNDNGTRAKNNTKSI